MVEAVKEQQAIVKEQQGFIQEQQKINAALRDELNELKERIR